MIKLYDEDSYLTEFSAIVEQCIDMGGEYKILLDKTAFFPTAGGQECDGGMLDGQAVLRVETENDEVYHIVKAPIPEGKSVHGAIKWQERFRKMQHHSAEHIVSGLVHSLFGYDNVGFHLSEKEVTMDYNGTLSEQELLKVERAANEAVWSNIQITASYPQKTELKSMSYRSKLELEENVRIVTIEGIDVCACCAPHVRSTGEIGVIKLKDMMRHRGGVRIKMICGMDALKDYEDKHASSVRISNLLSVKQEETAEGVEKILENISEMKGKISALTKRNIEYRLENLAETEGNMCLFEEDADFNMLRLLAGGALQKCGKYAAALAGNDADGYDYIILGDNVSERAKEINSALSGRGGGRGEMIQGHFGAHKKEIAAFFENF